MEKYESGKLRICLSTEPGKAMRAWALDWPSALMDVRSSEETYRGRSSFGILIAKHYAGQPGISVLCIMSRCLRLVTCSPAQGMLGFYSGMPRVARHFRPSLTRKH